MNGDQGVLKPLNFSGNFGLQSNRFCREHARKLVPARQLQKYSKGLALTKRSLLLRTALFLNSWRLITIRFLRLIPGKFRHTTLPAGGDKGLKADSIFTSSLNYSLVMPSPLYLRVWDG